MPRQAGFRFSIRLRHERANTAPAGDPIVGRIFCVGRRFCESRFFRRNEVFPVQPFSPVDRIHRLRASFVSSFRTPARFGSSVGVL